MSKIIKAKLVIPKGFKLVENPKFRNSTYVLCSDLALDKKVLLYWRDASLEAEAFESDLYIFIEKVKGK